mgnify:CR=1 FL=1
MLNGEIRCLYTRDKGSWIAEWRDIRDVKELYTSLETGEDAMKMIMGG